MLFAVFGDFQDSGFISQHDAYNFETNLFPSSQPNHRIQGQAISKVCV